MTHIPTSEELDNMSPDELSKVCSDLCPLSDEEIIELMKNSKPTSPPVKGNASIWKHLSSAEKSDDSQQS